MANTKGFITKVAKSFGMRPVVPFQTPLAIGDVGYIGKDGTWNPVSTTRQRFGLEPGGVRTERDVRGIWDLSSGRDVQFRTYAKGETSKLVSAVADAKARAEIEFGSARSFVFAAKAVSVRSATNFDALIDAIRLAYHNRKQLPEDRRWDAKLAFVFAVADADRFVTVLADQGKTTLAVSGSAKVGPPTAPAELTGRVSFGSASNELQKVNLTRARNCFYRAYGLNPSIFRRWNNEDVGEVSFVRSGWQYLGGEGIDALGGRSPGALFGGEIGDFDQFGGPDEVGFRVSTRPINSFEETFTEV